MEGIFPHSQIQLGNERERSYALISLGFAPY